MSLEQHIRQLKAYRNERDSAAEQVLSVPDGVGLLLDYIARHDPELSHRAAWTLERVCIKKLSALAPQLPYFVELLAHNSSQSAIRSLAKVCELLCTEFYTKKKTLVPLQTKQRAELVSVCFDWLIGPHKVATKAYAMHCLYLLGKEFDWVHPELKALLEKDYAGQLPAYKARARMILSKLEF